MSNLFSKLTSFGISSTHVKEGGLFAASEKPRDKAAEEQSRAANLPLIERSMDCPVCSKRFTTISPVYSKLKLVSTDTDFKPRYEPIDPLYYEIAICPLCGYASMLSTFKQIREASIDLIKKEITPKYKHKTYAKILDAPNALERYQLALFSAVVKKAKSSEIAYLCLKLGWLSRDTGNADDEKMYLTEACKGFMIAFEKENLPLFGMDKATLEFLLGELNRRIGNREEALRFLSRAVTDKTISPRLKDRAMDIRDQIKLESMKTSGK